MWSDSSYVVKAVNEHWLEKWSAKGFVNVKNIDLWIRFIELYKKHRVTFHWIKGHAGHPENERCDTIAVAACHGPTLINDNGYLATIKSGTCD